MFPFNVAVVINTYNCKPYIQAAVESVLAQTLAPAEVVVVDDGSSDGTMALVQSVFGDRVRYHYHSNRGISQSRNVGVRICSAEWVAFLDADDTWMAEKLERQAEAAGDNPRIGMVLCDGVEVSEDGTFLAALTLPRPLSTDLVRSRLRSRCMITTSGVVIRRKALLAVGEFPTDLSFGEDWLTFAKVAMAYEVATAHKPLFRKTQLTTGLSGNPELALQQGIVCLRRCRGVLTRSRWPERWFDAMAFRRTEMQLRIHASRMYVRRGEKSKAIVTVAAGIARWPFLGPTQLRSLYWLFAELYGPGTSANRQGQSGHTT